MKHRDRVSLTYLFTYLRMYIHTCLLAYVLTYLLMFSDKHNSRIARPRNLTSSLINVTLSQDVPFHQPQQLQCLNHGATSVPLCATNLQTNPLKMTICGRHVMARHKDCRATSHTIPCSLCYKTSSALLKLRRYGFHVSRYGVHVSRVYSPCFPLWLDGLQKSSSWCFLLHCCVTDRKKLSTKSTSL